MNTRRDFLASFSLLAAGAVLEPVKVLSAPLMRRDCSIGQLSLSTLAGCIHTPFHITRPAPSRIRLVLIEARPTLIATPLSDRETRAAESGFALLFRGPQQFPLSQNTYSLEHQSLGQISMFIVPVCRRHGDEYFYEAIFNPATGPMV